MTEYDTQARTIRKQTARLKALRLAKEAQAHNPNRDRQQLRAAILDTGDQFYTDSHFDNPP
jgi:hypothetical protein